MRVAPYPYERWPRLRREEARALRQLSSIAPAWRPGSAVLEVGGALLSAAIDVAPGAPETCSSAEARHALREPLVAVELHLRAARGGSHVTALVQMPVEHALGLVDRTLGGEGRIASPAGEPFGELARGALGYLAARMCGRSAAGARVHAIHVQRDEALAALAHAEAASDKREGLVRWPVELELDGTRVALTVWLALRDVARMELEDAALASGLRDVPSALYGLPIALCAHAATLTLSHAELSALQLGDVVVPERCGLCVGRDGWYGSVALHAIGAGVCLGCELRGRELTIGESFARATGGHGMAEGKRAHAEPETTTAAGAEAQAAEPGKALLQDAPVELCVEVARFSLPLPQLLALRAGEVWSTGRAIGEDVFLSAGGRKVARGELVDVDGDIGVRILERF